MALAYSPTLSDSAAWRRLNRWIEHNAALSDELHQLGYDGSQRTFTPRMVARIVSVLHGVPAKMDRSPENTDEKWG